MRITFPIVFAVLAACGPSMQSSDGGGGVRLDVEPAARSPGDSVLLTLTNASPDPIGYNLCSSGLEVREDSGWRPLPSSRVCTMELRILEPDTATRYRFDLPTDLPAGEYRFITTVERLEAGDRVSVRTGAFTVRQDRARRSSPEDGTRLTGVPCGDERPASPEDGRVVTVYFNCDSAPPGGLAPVAREVEGGDTATADRKLDTALRALVAGPTAEERERGFFSFFSEATDVEVIEARLTDDGDTAWVDFTTFDEKLPDRHGVKSFVPPGVMAELTWTLFQSFPDLQAVRFAFDGDEDAFWAWLGGPAQTFTRRDWGRV